VSKAWIAGPFIGSIIVGGAAFIYAPEDKIEKLDIVKKTEYINEKKMFLTTNDMKQFKDKDTNDFIVLSENYVEGRYEKIYFTNKKQLNEWRIENAKIQTGIE